MCNCYCATEKIRKGDKQDKVQNYFLTHFEKLDIFEPVKKAQAQLEKV